MAPVSPASPARLTPASPRSGSISARSPTRCRSASTRSGSACCCWRPRARAGCRSVRPSRSACCSSPSSSRSRAWRRSWPSWPATRSPARCSGCSRRRGLALGLALFTGTPGVPVMTIGFYLFAFAAPSSSWPPWPRLGKPLIAAHLVLSGTRAILDGLYQVSGTTGLERAAGYVAAAIAAVALYAGTAFLLEDLRQHAVLPVFRRGAGAAAMDGDRRRAARPGPRRGGGAPAALVRALSRQPRRPLRSPAAGQSASPRARRRRRRARARRGSGRCPSPSSGVSR